MITEMIIRDCLFQEQEALITWYKINFLKTPEFRLAMSDNFYDIIYWKDNLGFFIEWATKGYAFFPRNPPCSIALTDLLIISLEPKPHCSLDTKSLVSPTISLHLKPDTLLGHSSSPQPKNSAMLHLIGNDIKNQNINHLKRLSINKL